MRLMNKWFQPKHADGDSNGISYTLLDQHESEGCHLIPDDEDLFPDRTSGTNRSHFISFNVSRFLCLCLFYLISSNLCTEHMVTLCLKTKQKTKIIFIKSMHWFNKSYQTYVDYSNYCVVCCFIISLSFKYFDTHTYNNLPVYNYSFEI